MLDRSNPVRGDVVQGNILDTAFSSFVGLYPVPMRHGLTMGELARMLVGEFGDCLNGARDPRQLARISTERY